MKRLNQAAAVVLGVLLLFTACAKMQDSGGQSGPESTPAASQTGARPPKSDAVLTGKIVKLYDKSFLLTGSKMGELYTVSSALDVYVGGEKTDMSALAAGQTVEIGYSGMVMESYPMQLGSPEYIKIVKEGNDLVGFYENVIDELWDRDPGLNSNADVMAFDLSKAANLTEGEKSALIYIAAGARGLQGIAGTFDELSEQGYIDKENLSFKTGLLFTLTVSDAADESFTFSLKKWRSGTGAYGFDDCKAKKTDSGWHYTIGGEWIS